MKVRELIAELQKYPPDFGVHLDLCANEEIGGWEGDRVVRNLAGVRIQDGFKAVALDGHAFNDVEHARLKAQMEK